MNKVSCLRVRDCFFLFSSLRSWKPAPEGSRTGAFFLRVKAKWQYLGVWSQEHFQISWHVCHEALAAANMTTSRSPRLRKKGGPSRWSCLFSTLRNRCLSNIGHDAHFCKQDLIYLLHFHYGMGLPLPWENISADGLGRCGVEGIKVVVRPIAVL